MLRVRFTVSDWMVLRAAMETVLADPSPPPPSFARAPELLARLLATAHEAPRSLQLSPEELEALEYALAYQMRIRGYVVGRPGAIAATVALHDKLMALRRRQNRPRWWERLVRLARAR